MNWKLCLAILTCNVVFMSSSYTMLIPFLPMYLTRDLGVDPASVNIWSGIVFSSTFLISAVMAPYGDEWPIREASDSWQFAPVFFYLSVIFSAVS